jgi:hypothetical protein
MKSCARLFLQNYFAFGLSGLMAIALVAGCTYYSSPPPPGPVATVQTDYVPDDYIWDGYEYVGYGGGQYYYLGPNHVWVICDPVRAQRYHNWQTAHPDWHTHAVVNVNYRVDAHGHEHPRRPPPPPHPGEDHPH